MVWDHVTTDQVTSVDTFVCKREHGSCVTDGKREQEKTSLSMSAWNLINRIIM